MKHVQIKHSYIMFNYQCKYVLFVLMVQFNLFLYILDFSILGVGKLIKFNIYKMNLCAIFNIILINANNVHGE